MLSIFLIIVGFSRCGSLNFEKNPPFKITSAVSQNWSERQAGVQGINVKVAYSSNKTIEFDLLFEFKN